MVKLISNLREWAERDKKYCEEKHTKIMMSGDFLSAEMCEDFPEYWLGRIAQIDLLLDWIEK